MNGKVTINATIRLLQIPNMDPKILKKTIPQQLITVIQLRKSNIGSGNLFVDGPLNPIPGVVDLNECAQDTLHDCHHLANCVNLLGSFTCQCKAGYEDRFSSDETRSGRHCYTCSQDFCNGRGQCRLQNGEKYCM